jgi:hypothetical protein
MTRLDGAKRIDLKPGGVVILPDMPAGSTVRLATCGSGGVSLEFQSSNQALRLWVADRQGNAISLENRQVV